MRVSGLVDVGVCEVIFAVNPFSGDTALGVDRMHQSVTSRKSATPGWRKL
jgi:hypothetical protein